MTNCARTGWLHPFQASPHATSWPNARSRNTKKCPEPKVIWACKIQLASEQLAPAKPTCKKIAHKHKNNRQDTSLADHTTNPAIRRQCLTTMPNPLPTSSSSAVCCAALAFGFALALGLPLELEEALADAGARPAARAALSAFSEMTLSFFLFGSTNKKVKVCSQSRTAASKRQPGKNERYSKYRWSFASPGTRVAE